MINKMLAKQLGNPTSVVGGAILGSLWNHRNKALNDCALSHLELVSDDHLLEVGFGGGYLIGRCLEKITGGRICGVDVSASLVKKAGRKFKSDAPGSILEIKQGKAEALPFTDASFTKACSVNSVFYWDDPLQGFKEIRRILAPGGSFVLIMTDKASLEHKGFAKKGLHLFDATKIMELLDEAGLTKIRRIGYEDKHRHYSCYLSIVL